MGNSKSVFSEDELQDYEDLTYLTRKEILLAWKRWTELVGSNEESDKITRYPEETIQELPELKSNPFKDRITRVFSSAQDSRISFEDFLDLLSVMSDKAPLHLKAHYAFHIFDYNEDRSLDEDDLQTVVERLTGGDPGLLQKEKTKLVDRLLEETDLDGGGISEEEFKHLLTKCPDFVHSFRFSL